MKTLLFDLDDTILSYGGVAPQAWTEACEKHIRHFPSLSVSQLRQAIDDASHWYWSDPVRHRNGRLNLKKARREVMELTFENLNKTVSDLPSQEIAHAIADFFSVRREELVHPFPGAVETLQKLRQDKFPLGLLTNGTAEVQQAKIDRWKLEEYFDIILIEGALGYGKPDSRVFERALFHFEAAPHETTMVGDNLEADIYGASQLGIKTVWNDWRKSGLPQGVPAKPDRTIHAISELL